MDSVYCRTYTNVSKIPSTRLSGVCWSSHVCCEARSWELVRLAHPLTGNHQEPIIINWTVPSGGPVVRVFRLIEWITSSVYLSPCDRANALSPSERKKRGSGRV